MSGRCCCWGLAQESKPRAWQRAKRTSSSAKRCLALRIAAKQARSAADESLLTRTAVGLFDSKQTRGSGKLLLISFLHPGSPTAVAVCNEAREVCPQSPGEVTEEEDQNHICAFSAHPIGSSSHPLFKLCKTVKSYTVELAQICFLF